MVFRSRLSPTGALSLLAMICPPVTLIGSLTCTTLAVPAVFNRPGLNFLRRPPVSRIRAHRDHCKAGDDVRRQYEGKSGIAVAGTFPATP
jgi:hypothetical protein